MRTYTALVVVSGALFWFPLLLHRMRVSFRVSCGISVAAAVVAGTAAAAAGFGWKGGAAFALYGAVLVLFSIGIIRVSLFLSPFLPPEGIHAGVELLLFAPVAAADLHAAGWILRAALLASPQVAVGDMAGFNVFRGLYYGISPMGEYFILIPAWWRSVLFFGLAGGAAFLLRLLLVKVRGGGAKAGDGVGKREIRC